MLKIFVEDIDKGDDIQLLDLGLTSGSNIDFFARRVKKLYVFDILLNMVLNERQGHPYGKALRYFDYPEDSFDGVLLWDLFDRLDEQEGRELAELCHTMVKPGGKMMLFAQNEQTASVEVNSFVIRDNFQIEIRPHPRFNLPFYCRENRNIMKLLTPFTPVKSFIYRSGLREFLFQNT